MPSTTPLSDEQRRRGSKAALAALLEIARDLTASLAAQDRYDRLLAAIRRVVPYDAACLLRLDGDDLVPVAGDGLVPEALVRRYPRREHPRLDAILRASDPVRFPPDSPLPDPFDGLLEDDPHALQHIHACLGCPLTEGGEVVGALTADALEPNAFDAFDTRFLATLGALAGAALRTTALIEALERRAEQRGRVVRELQRHAIETSGDMIGASPALHRLLEEIAMVAASDLTVLVAGETGVGKERVAHQVHDLSPRRDEALIHVNCAALPESIAESELFGHVTGAFTGAVRDRAGKFEVADGGTLFLDEVGETSPPMQVKLLRALQERRIRPVGGTEELEVDVRVIAATNAPLEALVEQKRFREDLFWRLQVIPIRTPPLRERREDIPLLAQHFLERFAREMGKRVAKISEEAMRQLQAFDWPGNVRQLENVIERAVAFETTEAVMPERLPEAVRRPGRPGALPTIGDGFSLDAYLLSIEAQLLGEALERGRGDRAVAARLLGVSPRSLRYLLHKHGASAKN